MSKNYVLSNYNLAARYLSGILENIIFTAENVPSSWTLPCGFPLKLQKY